ncbi:hypothetical protein TURU_086296 [Turdus rufiventris]|nr:hypothetical protein TURU_086296 [Turdus rufiventris]
MQEIHAKNMLVSEGKASHELMENFKKGLIKNRNIQCRMLELGEFDPMISKDLPGLIPELLDIHQSILRKINPLSRAGDANSPQPPYLEQKEREKSSLEFGNEIPKRDPKPTIPPYFHTAFPAPTEDYPSKELAVL